MGFGSRSISPQEIKDAVQQGLALSKRGHAGQSGQAFVIMQIGNSDLDKIYHECISPAIKACKLEPKRVDKHTEGRLLKSEIVAFIESSDIIVADLTNERPNCYLEVGYAMGLDKFPNLILTAREDHNVDSPDYKKGGPKIHFDLSGYDILFWNPLQSDEFKTNLEKRIRNRLAIIRPTTPAPRPVWDENWIAGQSNKAFSGLKDLGVSAYMEIRMMPEYALNVPQGELLHQAEEAQIHTFGWPIGIVLNRDPYRPIPKTDGIVAEVSIKEDSLHKDYDYWALRKDGAHYLLKSLFEDERQTNAIFFNTRIVRITETLLHAARLYTGLKVPRDAHYRIGIRHGGLKGRALTVSSIAKRMPPHDRVSSENEVYSEIETTIEQTEANLVNLVESFTQPLFVVFNFFELQKNILEEIVNKFVAGEVT
jgi:hypothetical protein